MPELLEVKIWGDMACFTRPEMKVERVSYEVMTPSAARGILESIFGKPEFQWLIKEIWVLNAIRHFSILRNEITSRQSVKADAAKRGNYYADAGKNRAQRHTLALKNVAYIIRAQQKLAPHTKDSLIKYHTDLRRMISGILNTPSSIIFPKNVRIIGAINIDETTHYLSPKILDRAHIMKFDSPLLQNWDEIHPFFQGLYLYDSPCKLKPKPHSH